jgi:hypothetical protein
LDKYIIEEVVDLDVWDDFVSQSPHGTIFSYSIYMDLAVNFWKVYWVKKGDQVKAGLALLLNKDGDQVLLDDLVIHNGLMFALDAEQKATKARQSRFEITEFVIVWLTRKFQHIELSLAPQTEDLRPYLWHNYHSSNQSDRFDLDLRYTSYLDISSINIDNEEESLIFNGLETLRQRNIREARKSHSKMVIMKNSELFVQSYTSMMNSKNNTQDKDKLKRLKRLIDGLIQKQMANIYLTQNKNGESIYISIFGWDNKRAYYLFGAPILEAKERYKGTISFWDAFQDLSKRGLKEVDLEGINSPQRGWFKLSFGGNVIPYYNVVKSKE